MTIVNERKPERQDVLNRDPACSDCIEPACLGGPLMKIVVILSRFVSTQEKRSRPRAHVVARRPEVRAPRIDGRCPARREPSRPTALDVPGYVHPWLLELSSKGLLSHSSRSTEPFSHR